MMLKLVTTDIVLVGSSILDGIENVMEGLDGRKEEVNRMSNDMVRISKDTGRDMEELRTADLEGKAEVEIVVGMYITGKEVAMFTSLKPDEDVTGVELGTISTP